MMLTLMRLINISIILAIGCKPEFTPPRLEGGEGGVVAKVGDRILSAEEVAAWETSLRENLTPELRSSFIRHWVEDELLVQAAKDKGLEDDPWVEGRLDEVSRRLLAARLLELDAATLSGPSPSEIATYYAQHQGEFVRPKLSMTVQYWRAPTRTSLDRLRADLVRGRPSPRQPEDVVGLDSGRFEVDDPASVDPAVWRHFGGMNAGQLGYPVQFDGGIWMFKILRRDEPGARQSLDDVRDIITARLIEEARMRRQAELVRALAADYSRTGRLVWPVYGAETADSAARAAASYQE